MNKIGYLFIYTGLLTSSLSCKEVGAIIVYLMNLKDSYIRQYLVIFKIGFNIINTGTISELFKDFKLYMMKKKV